MFYDADFFARIVGSWHGNGIRLVGSCNGIRHWRHFGMSYQSGTLNWSALFEGGVALKRLWIFIVGPFVGGALAAGVWKFIGRD